MRAALAGLALVAATGFHASAEPRALTFEQAFDARGEPRSLHYRATYQARGAAHELEVWRDGQRRLKRETDRAVITFVTRKADSPEFQLTVLDLHRRMLTQIDRTNLYRVGDFTDWFDLSHGLRRPKGAYRLTAGAAPTQAPRALRACRWFDLAQTFAGRDRVTHVCWDGADRLPVLILSSRGETLWRVTTADRKPIPSRTFRIDARGYVRNNANEDIQND